MKKFTVLLTLTLLFIFSSFQANAHTSVVPTLTNIVPTLTKQQSLTTLRFEKCGNLHHYKAACGLKFDMCLDQYTDDDGEIDWTDVIDHKAALEKNLCAPHATNWLKIAQDAAKAILEYAPYFF